MGEAKRPSALFVRKASGLVREMSTASASFYNVVASIGGSPGMQLAMLPAAPLFLMQIGMWVIPGYSVGMAINSVLSLALIFIFLCLVSAMPRTGGDYVFTTRITSPFLGWLEGWGLLWTILGFMGTNVYVVAWSLSATLDIGAVVMGYSSWIPMVQWWSSNVGIFLLSIVVAIMILLQHLLPPKAYFNSFKWLVFGCLVLCCFEAPLFVGATPEKFTLAFENFSGMTAQQLADTAVASGIAYVPFSLGSLGVVTAFALFVFVGWQFSIYFAGELKGNVGRTAALSTFMGLLGPVFFNTIFIIGLVALLGWGGVLTNWGYLFWAGKAPLYGVVPFVPLIGAMLTPNWAVLGLIAGIGVFGLLVLILSSWAALISRIIFAWAMDRVIPSWFAAINSRTHAPLRLVSLAAVAVVVLSALAVLGANPAIALWFTVLMAVLTWVMPGVNAILLPYRRKDLFELAPSWAKKKIFGAWLLVIVGVIWLVFILFDYSVAFLAPFVSAVTTAGLGSFAGYAISTGIVSFIITNVVGALIWFTSKWYNAKRGIRFGDIFSQLPPE